MRCICQPPHLIFTQEHTGHRSWEGHIWTTCSSSQVSIVCWNLPAVCKRWELQQDMSIWKLATSKHMLEEEHGLMVSVSGALSNHQTCSHFVRQTIREGKYKNQCSAINTNSSTFCEIHRALADSCQPSPDHWVMTVLTHCELQTLICIHVGNPPLKHQKFRVIDMNQSH